MISRMFGGTRVRTSPALPYYDCPISTTSCYSTVYYQTSSVSPTFAAYCYECYVFAATTRLPECNLLYSNIVKRELLAAGNEEPILLYSPSSIQRLDRYFKYIFSLTWKLRYVAVEIIIATIKRVTLYTFIIKNGKVNIYNFLDLSYRKIINWIKFIKSHSLKNLIPWFYKHF